MTLASISDQEEPFIYTTRRNTLVVVERGIVLILAGREEINLLSDDFEEIVSALERDRRLTGQNPG
jgi:hypothetical protein